MRRLAAAVAILTGSALVVVSGAAAAKPFHLRQSAGPTVYPAGQVCTFGVRLEPQAPDVLNTFIFSNGDLFFDGPEVMTATNLSSGRSVKLNISGTLSIKSGSDGSTTLAFTGPTLLEGGIVNDGHAVFSFNASGDLVASSVAGHQTDLCAELAST